LLATQINAGRATVDRDGSGTWIKFAAMESEYCPFLAVGRFYRGDTSNEPPPGLDDQDAINGMTEFFQTGLKNLKALAEKK
jgi:hypothetical protein